MANPMPSAAPVSQAVFSIELSSPQRARFHSTPPLDAAPHPERTNPMRKLLAGLLASLAFSASAQQLPPFQPVDTKNVAVTGTAATLTLPTALAGTGSVQYVLTSFCSGTELIFVRTDGTAATVSNGMPIVPTNAVLITLPASRTTISVIGQGTACTIYATVGLGG